MGVGSSGDASTLRCGDFTRVLLRVSLVAVRGGGDDSIY